MDEDQSVIFAQKYLEDIISFFGQNLTVTTSLNDDVIELVVETSELNSLLIGRNAETLRSLQQILSSALRNQDAAVVRVNVDIADYKKQRNEKIAEKAREWVAQVRESGDPYVAHINAADRRVVHHVVSEYSDVESHSEGEGRERRVVISKTTQ